jgi:hypothetical protein
VPAVGWDERSLVAEPGEGVLVVAGEVLAVGLVAAVVVVGAGVGVIGVMGHHGPGDRQQGVPRWRSGSSPNEASWLLSRQLVYAVVAACAVLDHG